MSKLWAVEGDPNSHGNGNLIASNHTVFINGIPVIKNSDPAEPDKKCPGPPHPHCNPLSVTGSSSVFVYGNEVHREDDKRICGAKTMVENQSTVFAGD